jgi:hypothetical protein
MADDYSDGEPWRYRFIMVPAMLACVVVDGAAIYYYIEGSCGILECMRHLPSLNFIAVTLAVLGMKAKAFERAFLVRRSRPIPLSSASKPASSTEQ